MRKRSCVASRQCSMATSGRPPDLACKKPSPIMPSGAAAWVVCLVDNAANFFQSPNMFGVMPKRVFYFCLFEHGIDAAQPVGFVSGIMSRRRSASLK